MSIFFGGKVILLGVAGFLFLVDAGRIGFVHSSQRVVYHDLVIIDASLILTWSWSGYFGAHF
jgi:hypothetical protein